MQGFCSWNSAELLRWRSHRNSPACSSTEAASPVVAHKASLGSPSQCAWQSATWATTWAHCGSWPALVWLCSAHTNGTCAAGAQCATISDCHEGSETRISSSRVLAFIPMKFYPLFRWFSVLTERVIPKKEFLYMIGLWFIFSVKADVTIHSSPCY